MPEGGRFLALAIAVGLLEIIAVARWGSTGPHVFIIVLAVLALFVTGFVWMSKAPDNRRIKTFRGYQWRLGPKGTRRFGVVFACLWAVLAAPAVLSNPDRPLTWGIAILGIGASSLLWRGKHSNPSPPLSSLVVQEKQRRWLPWVLVFIAVFSFVMPALALYAGGARELWLFAVFSGFPGIIVSYTVFRILRDGHERTAETVRRQSPDRGAIQTDHSQWIAGGLLILAVLVLIFRDDLSQWWSYFIDQGVKPGKGEATVVVSAPVASRGGGAPQAAIQLNARPAASWHIVVSAPSNAIPLPLSSWLARPWKLAQGARHRPLEKHHPLCWLEMSPGDGTVFYTSIRLGEIDHCIAVTGWDTGMPQLWFDIDGDGRFDDSDGRYRNQGNGRLATMVEIPMPVWQLRHTDPRNGVYRLWLWVWEAEGGELQLSYYPTTELVTHTVLRAEAGTVLAVVAELPGGQDGNFLDDGVYLDLNGDGRLEQNEYVPPGGGLLSLDGRAWQPQVRFP